MQKIQQKKTISKDYLLFETIVEAYCLIETEFCFLRRQQEPLRVLTCNTWFRYIIFKEFILQK